MHLYIYIYTMDMFFFLNSISLVHTDGSRYLAERSSEPNSTPKNMKPDAGASPMMYLQYLHVSSIRTRFCSEYLQRLNSLEPCAKCGNPAHGI